MISQIVGGMNQICDIGREIGIGKVTVAAAQPCKVKTKYGEALAINERAIRDADTTSLPQVKQWANRAKV